MKQIISILSLFSIVMLSAQEVDKDTIKTEEVNIIKPYTPQIKDAFKIKAKPVINKDTLSIKKEVDYSISSFPVASTFTPSKGKAKGVSQKKRERVFENYIDAGFGNYITPKIEAFAHSSTTRDNDFGAKLKYHSSNGGLKEVQLDNDFMNAGIEAYYTKSVDNFDWKATIGYQYQKQNWYGLTKNNALTDVQIANIESKQVYNGFDIGGNIKYYDANFKGSDVNFSIFTDAYNSSEFHFLLKPQFEFLLLGEWTDVDLRVEYINGGFDKNYIDTNSLEYGYFNAGISPKVKIIRDFFTVNIGANLVYTSALKNNGLSAFFIYPNITANYELIQDVVTVYAGVTGDLHQHSYQNFANKNTYVSPTLNIGRTNEMYHAKLGFKGKVASNVSFNINASYKDENGKFLFKLNDELAPATAANYQYANSFKVVYDNVATIGFFGELNYDYSKEIRLGGSVNYNIYNTEKQDDVWNLPTLNTAIFAKYDAKKIIAGVDLFLVGETKDQYFDTALSLVKITNKAFVDLNVNLGYRVTNRLSAYINGNNLLGKNYQRYTNYKVQGIQVLGGIKYKFDL